MLLKRRSGGMPLWAMILLAAVGVGLFGGRGIGGLGVDAAAVCADRSVLELLAIIVLIYLYSHLLQKTGRMERITDTLNGLLRDPRAVMVAVPGLVGLIPMPGGAMFTAPITDRVGDRMAISREDKVFSNYWFRHCWELAFPLYPGIILCAGLMQEEPITLTWTLLPLAATAFCAGLALFLTRAGSGVAAAVAGETPENGPCSQLSDEVHENIVIAAVADQSGAKQSGRSKQTKQIASAALPPRNDDFTTPSVSNLATVSENAEEACLENNIANGSTTDCTSCVGGREPVGAARVLSELWPLIGVIVLALFRVPLIIGLLAIILAFAFAERVSPREFFACGRASFNLPILVLIWSVFLFGRELAETGMLGRFSSFLVGAGLPLIGLSFLLPFVMGALTGVTTGFVGTVFPLLLPLWPIEQRMTWLQFAYASGLVGAFLTPSHLCLSMTQEYFRASLRKVVLLVLVPSLVVMLVAWGRLP